MLLPSALEIKIRLCKLSALKFDKNMLLFENQPSNGNLKEDTSVQRAEADDFTAVPARNAIHPAHDTPSR
jgi:hypothetical protein